MMHHCAAVLEPQGQAGHSSYYVGRGRLALRARPVAQLGKILADKRASNLWEFGYLCCMKPASQPMPVESEKLKPVLHDKIERMDGQHLAWLNRLLLQLEAEELADRLSEAFDKDHEQGLQRCIPELVKQFRTGHRYA